MSSLNDQGRPSAPGPSLNSRMPAPDPALASLRRRRLIKLGASSVPVALTLSSRPVFAANQCNTTSAWGSAILNTGGASVRARAASAQLMAQGWSISALAGNQVQAGVGGGNAPWQFIYNVRYNGAMLATGKTASQYAQATLKVADLFPGGISGYVATLDGTVFTYLKANPSTTNFVTCMLVARLNALYGSAGVSQCLMGNSNGNDTLAQMASGQFLPSNGSGSAWSKDTIVRYLVENNIVTA